MSEGSINVLMMFKSELNFLVLIICWHLQAGMLSLMLNENEHL
jgi:hypothetical protein